jgi:hypothetical protein
MQALRAVRDVEGWTTANLVTGGLLLVVFIVVAVWAIRRYLYDS